MAGEGWHKRHVAYMNMARDIAEHSTVRSSQHGCVIVGRRDCVLACACNAQCSHLKRCGIYTLHAEELAVRMLGSRKRRARVVAVYVARLRGRHVHSHPCSRCARRVTALGAPVYYTTSEGAPHQPKRVPATASSRHVGRPPASARLMTM